MIGWRIDLRDQSELEEGYQPWPGRSSNRAHVPFFPSLDRWTVQSVIRSPPKIGRRYYEFLLDGRDAVLEVCRRLARSRGKPTLIHCASGRDRTGIVIACVLGLIGVADATIASDYAESRVMNDAEGRHADPECILHMLKVIRKQHGSVAALLSDKETGGDPVRALRQALIA